MNAHTEAVANDLLFETAETQKPWFPVDEEDAHTDLFFQGRPYTGPSATEILLWAGAFVGAIAAGASFIPLPL